jgi:hypothetical protein
MSHRFFWVGLVGAGLSVAAQSPPLPPEVISFNRRVQQTVACHPKGETIEQVMESLAALQSQKECADLERERAVLIDRYKDNKDAVNALKPKFGFVSVYRPPNSN